MTTKKEYPENKNAQAKDESEIVLKQSITVHGEVRGQNNAFHCVITSGVFENDDNLAKKQRYVSREFNTRKEAEDELMRVLTEPTKKSVSHWVKEEINQAA